MSVKDLLSENFNFSRVSIFENTTPFTIVNGNTENINIGNDIINQCQITNDSGNVIPHPKLKDEFISLSLELEGFPDNKTSLYWTIEGISSPFNQVIDQKSTFKTGTNYLHFGERIFTPDEWQDETSGFIFKLTNNGNHPITINRIRTNFKSYFISLKGK